MRHAGVKTAKTGRKRLKIGISGRFSAIFSPQRLQTAIVEARAACIRRHVSDHAEEIRTYASVVILRPLPEFRSRGLRGAGPFIVWRFGRCGKRRTEPARREARTECRSS